MESMNEIVLQTEDFVLATQEEKDAEKIVRPSLTYWQDVWRRLKQNKLAVVSMFFLIFLTILVFILPYVYPYAYDVQDLSNTNQGPSLQHIFGTDAHGRDLFIRVMYGTKVSLLVGIVASVINFTIGVSYGGVAGYLGGKIDNIMMRIVDIMSTIPLTLYVILLMVMMPENKGMKNILIAIGTIYWIGMARIVRGQIFSLKEQEYVMAERVLGASGSRILFKHLIPNALGPIIVNLTMSIPSAIFTEAFLSFIGLGISAPRASLGSLCNDVLDKFAIYPHLLLFPAMALCLIILSFNFLGDGLRDALDPKMRK
jgi:oligopeptide ABC transporter, permease protein oppC